MPSRQPFQHNAPNPVSRAMADAMAHHKAGRLAEAEPLYRKVLTLAPKHSDASRLLGGLCLQVGRAEEALPLLRTALQAQPKNPEIHNNLGIALNTVGEALRNSGHSTEAMSYFQEACQINPAYVEALTNLGVALYQEGHDEAALDYCERALTEKPNHIAALMGSAVALWRLWRGDEALEKLARALEIEPHNAGVITTVGEILHGQGKIDEALEQYSQALVYKPEYQRALFKKAMALLAKGEYREGWKLYEAGFGQQHERGLNPFDPAKPWDGIDAPTKHLLIWCEQGFGDSLQFIRYAELCKQRFAKVSVLCVGQKPLVRLFKGLPFIDDSFDTIRDGSHFDAHVPMVSLPHLFGTVLETVPAAIPYLRVDPAIQAKWAAKFAGGTTIKVGLVWAGASRPRDNADRIDRERSIGLERMKPWLDLQGAQFFALQKDKPAEQVVALGLRDRLTDYMGEVEDFADTAAIVENLDLVITVDTSVAHLAGGLGKPVWILSRYNACWRWLQNRPTNPWYPTARIFGQPSMGDWDSVIAEVGRELALEIAKRAH
jgi:tetratricopeptide (TPR) repeat protein